MNRATGGLRVAFLALALFGSATDSAMAQAGEQTLDDVVDTAGEAERFLDGDFELGRLERSISEDDEALSPALARRFAGLYRRRLGEAVRFVPPDDGRLLDAWGTMAQLAAQAGDDRLVREALENGVLMAERDPDQESQHKLLGLLGNLCQMDVRDRNGNAALRSCGRALALARAQDEQEAVFALQTLMVEIGGDRAALSESPTIAGMLEAAVSAEEPVLAYFAAMSAESDGDSQKALDAAQNAVRGFESMLEDPEGTPLGGDLDDEEYAGPLPAGWFQYGRQSTAAGLAAYSLVARLSPEASERRQALEDLERHWAAFTARRGLFSNRALDPRTDVNAAVVLGDAWANAASAGAGLEDRAAAARYIERYDDLVRRWPRPPQTTIWLRNRSSVIVAGTLFATDRRDEAHGRMRAMAASADQALRRSALTLSEGAGLSTLQDAAQDYYRPLWMFLYTSVFLQRDAPDAFVAAQWLRSSDAGLALREASARQAARTPQAARTLDERRRIVERLNGLERQGGAYTSGPEIADLRDQLENVEARLAREVPRYRDLLSPLPVSVAQVQRTLQADEAVVVYSNYGDLVAFVVRATGDPVMIPLATTAPEVAERVATLRRTLSIQDGVEPAAFDLALAQELYERVFARITPWLEGVGRVFVVAHGPLESLPLAVLVAGEPGVGATATERYRNTPWLGLKFAFTTLPDVSSLILVRQQDRRAPPGGGLIGFGDPILGPPQTFMADLNRPVHVTLGAMTPTLQSIRELPSVPETGDLLRGLARQFDAPPGSIHLQARATEAAVKGAAASGELGRARVLVFATHGIAGARDVEAGLVLTPPDEPTPTDDAYLTASEAAELNLNADWVILSACNTASGGDGQDRPLSGLARAFFLAGSRSVLVSHWPVEARATRTLVEGTLSRWAAGETRAEALRVAQRDMLLNGQAVQAHPAFWGAFVVSGEGR